MYNVKEVTNCLIECIKISNENNKDITLNKGKIKLNVNSLLNIFDVCEKKMVDKNNNTIIIDSLDLTGLDIDMSKLTSFKFEFMLKVITHDQKIKYYNIKTPYYKFKVPSNLATNYRNRDIFQSLNINTCDSSFIISELND